MLEAIRHGTSDNLANTETEVPERETRGLLGLCIPLAADEDQGRADGGLKDAKEDTGDEESLVIGGGGGAGGCDAPAGDVGTEPLRGGHHLEEVD